LARSLKSATVQPPAPELPHSASGAQPCWCGAIAAGTFSRTPGGVGAAGRCSPPQGTTSGAWSAAWWLHSPSAGCLDWGISCGPCSIKGSGDRRGGARRDPSASPGRKVLGILVCLALVTFWLLFRQGNGTMLIAGPHFRLQRTGLLAGLLGSRWGCALYYLPTRPFIVCLNRGRGTS
jgi:hypothetical protein